MINNIYLINKFSILNGAKYFSSGKLQNYLVFIPAKNDVKYLHATTQVYLWKLNGMSGENVENITKSGSDFVAIFVDYHVLPDTIFNGHCLINKNISITKQVINLYTSYVLRPWLKNLNTDFTLKNYLFGSVKLTTNADPYKQKYTVSGIGFNSRSEFSSTDECMGNMPLYLELRWPHLCILIIKIKIS